MPKEKICGIYCIENKLNNKKYIGQSIDINKRLNDHIRELKNTKHHNKHLQRSWDTYGANSFLFTVVQEASREELNNLEIYYIKEFKTNDIKYGYNMNDGGGNTGPSFHSEETKQKISNLQKGRKLTEEWKQSISKSLKGKTPKNFEILEGIRESKKLKVRQYDIYGNLIFIHNSVNDCARALNSQPTNAVKALKGKNKTFQTYILIYDDEFTESILQEKLSKITKKMINRYKKHGRFH